MDVDPETPSGSDAAGEGPRERETLPATESLAEGLLKGRYLLGQQLGRGGFAVTYLAADLELASRKVVVKILHDFRTHHSWALKKFQDEMEALARIDHPNVVSVLDYGYGPDNKPFLVMQYIRGRSLREMLPRDGLPLGQVAHIMKQAGRALSAAHEAGVCHRDLKPENIMIQSDAHGDQEVKLIDFGMGSIREGGEDVSTTGLGGTYSYMAPEQFHGKWSFATDVYQLGVVAYELVTGILPFRAPTPGGLVLEHMEGLRVLPKDLRPNLPEKAQAVILKAISPQPEDRYQSAREFGDELSVALISDGHESVPWIRAGSTASSGRNAVLLKTEVRKSPWVRRAFVAAIVVAACVIGYFVWRARTPSAQSVAVLPFENRTGDAGMAYLTEGITESVINDLSHIPTLRVIARGSVVKYDGAKIDAQTAGRELGVGRVIDGSLSREGDEFHLDTELIDVRSGVRLWGYAYSAEISSLTGVLQQFSAEVTDQLRLKLSGTLKERLKRQYAVGSEAYQQYLKGRFYLNKRSPADFQEAIRYFEQAIAADPEYAPAYAGLADTYGLMASFGGYWGGAVPAEALERSRQAAERALQLDGTLAEAYADRGFVEMQADYRWDSAEADFRRAIELNPNLADAHESYSFDLGSSGRFDEAVREVNVAADLQPGSLGMNLAKGMVLYMAGRYDDSLAALHSAVKTPVTDGLTADSIALDYWAKSMPAEALKAIERMPPDFTPHMRVPVLAAAYARAGQTDKAKSVLASYVIQPNVAWWYYLSLAHLSLGDTEDALSDLERAYRQRDEEVIWLAVDPMFRELRANPRFRALLRQTGRSTN